MLLYKHSSTFHILENSIRKRGFDMINLLMHAIIFCMQLLNVVTLGVVDNLAVVYGALVLATLYVLVKLDKHFPICLLWQEAGLFTKSLIFVGLVLNALPTPLYWLVGIFLIMLAFFITPTKKNVKEAKKPSLFSKLKDVILEYYNESNFKNKSEKIRNAFKEGKKSSTSEEDKKDFKNLPPV